MSLHEHLLRIAKKLPGDFEPYGERDRDTDYGPDCSCGCRHFILLAGELGADWGVCGNTASPRCALLTFEHQGCAQFESEAAARRADLSEESPPKRVRIRLGEFVSALEGFPSGEVEYVLEIGTGESLPLFEEDDAYDALRERMDAAEVGCFIPIERINSHESFQIMENFAQAQTGSTLKDRLLDALSRKGPFRRFREIVQTDPALREHWFAFHKEAMAEYGRRLLATHGIEVEWIQ